VGFETGLQALAMQGGVRVSAPKALPMPVAEGPNGEALLARVQQQLPAEVQVLAAYGALRCLEYQDREYASLYLDRLLAVLESERSFAAASPGFSLSNEVARQLALQMCYEDTIRVAEIKTSGKRMREVRTHLNVSAEQPAHVVEYFHPRFEELCDTLPRAIGKRMLSSQRARRWMRPWLGKGRNITTTNLMGYLQLATLARLKRWRRGTYRFSTQTELIETWLARIHSAGDVGYAVEIAQAVGMVKGYGDTYERGLHRYQAIVSAAENLSQQQRTGFVRKLRQAALADEDGKVFASALKELS
jgi:indolepyruvate ferredoxin oxidoreductase, beta subunit